MVRLSWEVDVRYLTVMIGLVWLMSPAQAQMQNYFCGSEGSRLGILVLGPDRVQVSPDYYGSPKTTTFVNGKRELLTIDFVRISPSVIDVGSIAVATGRPALEYKIDLRALMLLGVFGKGHFAQIPCRKAN